MTPSEPPADDTQTDAGRCAPDLLTQGSGADSNGFPLCDVCDKPAVWSEFHGWRHSTPEYRFGVPATLDGSGHEVTAKRWMRGGMS